MPILRRSSVGFADPLANHRLWAPWRLQYLKGDKPDECIFCTRPAMGDDERALIAHRGDSCYVILNAFPYTNGHVMVAPYEHVSDLRDLERRGRGGVHGAHPALARTRSSGSTARTASTWA